jgi:hypothetical protein
MVGLSAELLAVLVVERITEMAVLRDSHLDALLGSPSESPRAPGSALPKK